MDCSLRQFLSCVTPNGRRTLPTDDSFVGTDRNRSISRFSIGWLPIIRVAPPASQKYRDALFRSRRNSALSCRPSAGSFGRTRRSLQDELISQAAKTGVIGKL